MIKVNVKVKITCLLTGDVDQETISEIYLDNNDVNYPIVIKFLGDDDEYYFSSELIDYDNSFCIKAID